MQFQIKSGWFISRYRVLLPSGSVRIDGVETGDRLEQAWTTPNGCRWSVIGRLDSLQYVLVRDGITIADGERLESGLLPSIKWTICDVEHPGVFASKFERVGWRRTLRLIDSDGHTVMEARYRWLAMDVYVRRGWEAMLPFCIGVCIAGRPTPAAP